MVAGINWVAARKAEANSGSGGIDFAVANMSISTNDDANPCHSGSDAVHKAICGLVQEGVVFSLSAGNDNREKAAYPEVMAVAAVADFDGVGSHLGTYTCYTDEDDTRANFSNYGPEIDIAAPGVCIRSTWRNGGYNTISGTSMAAPHVAGAVALYLEANNLPTGKNPTDVDAIEAAILNAGLDPIPPDPNGYTSCSYITNEPNISKPAGVFLQVNAVAFGGDGSCDTGKDGTTNQAPVASAGGDQTVDDSDGSGDEWVSLDGSGSFDPDGSIVSHSWVEGGTEIATGANPSVLFNVGNYSVTLIVTDDAGATASDVVQITVNSPQSGISLSGIAPNSVQAGSSVEVTITGTGFVDGASVILENGSGPAPVVSSVTVESSTSIKATISTSSSGPRRNRIWDMRVSNPDGSSAVLSNAFTVIR
jgi:hypothetical protein